MITCEDVVKDLLFTGIFPEKMKYTGKNSAEKARLCRRMSEACLHLADFLDQFEETELSDRGDNNMNKVGQINNATAGLDLATANKVLEAFGEACRRVLEMIREAPGFEVYSRMPENDPARKRALIEIVTAVLENERKRIGEDTGIVDRAENYSSPIRQ